MSITPDKINPISVPGERDPLSDPQGFATNVGLLDQLATFAQKTNTMAPGIAASLLNRAFKE
ncbi:hypothetical protein MUP32_04775 [Candidatus Microgenomates bacterium]|nr:hypothetical protein [Candidatus Microgenomates bacterium]